MITNRETLKAFYDEDPQIISFKDYFDGDKTINFRTLPQEEIVIDGYPWGFRLRTQMKYWVETTSRGDRLCTQSLNPKTLKWCAIKKSTYEDIMILVCDNTGKVGTVRLNANDGESKIKAFTNAFMSLLNDHQKKRLALCTGYTEVMKSVKFTVRARTFKHKVTGEITTSVPVFKMGEYEEVNDEGEVVDRVKEDKEQKETDDLIKRAVSAEASSAYKNMRC